LTRLPPAAAKPYVFFDLGETIINLRDTIGVLAALIQASYPTIVPRGQEIAKAWFLGLASAVPRAPTAQFESQYDVGRRILSGLFRENGLVVDDLIAGRMLRDAWGRWQDGARLCEGVTKEWLREIGLLSSGVGAVTDGDDEDVRRLLEKIGLTKYFNSVVTSESVKAYKPNSIVYRTALASLGAEPRDSVFVSDSLVDLEGARAVGMAAVWFNREASGGVGHSLEGVLLVTRPDQLNRILQQFAQVGRFEG
jgi:2-haloalkanoic acid dehalogenase type II